MREVGRPAPVARSANAPASTRVCACQPLVDNSTLASQPSGNAPLPRGRLCTTLSRSRPLTRPRLAAVTPPRAPRARSLPPPWTSSPRTRNPRGAARRRTSRGRRGGTSRRAARPALAAHDRRARRRPPRSTRSPKTARRSSTVLDDVAPILDGGIRLGDPRTVAHLHPAPLIAAAAAELAVGVTNQSMDAFDASPAGTFVEDALVTPAGAAHGLGDSGSGVMTMGGTASNLLGLLLARDRAGETAPPTACRPTSGGSSRRRPPTTASAARPRCSGSAPRP